MAIKYVWTVGGLCAESLLAKRTRKPGPLTLIFLVEVQVWFVGERLPTAGTLVRLVLSVVGVHVTAGRRLLLLLRLIPAVVVHFGLNGNARVVLDELVYVRIDRHPLITVLLGYGRDAHGAVTYRVDLCGMRLSLVYLHLGLQRLLLYVRVVVVVLVLVVVAHVVVDLVVRRLGLAGGWRRLFALVYAHVAVARVHCRERGVADEAYEGRARHVGVSLRRLLQHHLRNEGLVLVGARLAGAVPHRAVVQRRPVAAVPVLLRGWRWRRRFGVERGARRFGGDETGELVVVAVLAVCVKLV